MRTTPVFVFGLGPIGQQIARLATEWKHLELIGGVDIQPQLIGKPLKDVLGIPQVQGVVASDVRSLKPPPGSVALHATGSSLAQVAPQLEALMAAGCDVVSTCEELSFPWFHQRALAQTLDAVAKRQEVSLLGTGVNPGFAMDTLPLVATAASQRVDAIKVIRQVAAATRREPLQRKIGASLTPAAFEEGVRSGKIRHVGLPESVAAVGSGLGFELDRIEEKIEPVIAQKRILTPYLTVEVGQVAGVHQIARGYRRDEERVFLELTMSVDVPASVDKVILHGTPPMTLTLEGIHGDVATATIALNSVVPLSQATPGLKTMVDLSLVHR